MKHQKRASHKLSRPLFLFTDLNQVFSGLIVFLDCSQRVFFVTWWIGERPVDDRIECYRRLATYFDCYNRKRKHSSIGEEVPERIYLQLQQNAA